MSLYDKNIQVNPNRPFDQTPPGPGLNANALEAAQVHSG
jgi:hypothetical protein